METLMELRELASLDRSPCVTLYLNTFMKDPVARDRARGFVERRVERALRLAESPQLRADLARVLAEAKRRFEDTEGAPRAIAIFACGAMNEFRVLDLPAGVEDQLVIGDAPALRQLARLCDEYERTLLVLVSAEDARIFEIVLGRVESSETIAGAPVNTKRSDKTSPGWIDVRYQRHVREHIDRHLREVAERTTKLVDAHKPHVVLVGGSQPTIDRFLHELPSRIRTRVVDVIALPPEAPIASVVQAAMESTRDEERRREIDGVKTTVDLALAGGPAALGLPEVLDAARERRLMTLFLDYGFKAEGARCNACGALVGRDAGECPYCFGAVTKADLSEAIVKEAISQDGQVDFVPNSQLLKRFDGIAALLRW